MSLERLDLWWISTASTLAPFFRSAWLIGIELKVDSAKPLMVDLASVVYVTVPELMLLRAISLPLR